MTYRRFSLKTYIFFLIVILIPYCCFAESEIPFTLPGKTELEKLKTAVIFTNKGQIRVELFPDEAPWHIANLKYLADKGYYKNTKFHLFIEDYIIQGGDPTGTGKGGPGYTLPPEFSSRKHQAGTFGMARIPDFHNPERRSNGSQFHILLSPAYKMDNEYTIMGEVVNGMNVVKNLRKGDIIKDLIVYVRN